MDKLKWLMTEFGFSLRQIADMLDVSASLVHKALLGQRRLGPTPTKILEDSLFTPYPIEVDESKLTWADPDPEWRIKEMSVRRLNLQTAIAALEKKMEDTKARHRKLHTLLQHTRHLPLTPAGGESLIVQWWILQRAKASYALLSFTRRKMDAMQIESTKMKAELLLINEWLEESE